MNTINIPEERFLQLVESEKREKVVNGLSEYVKNGLKNWVENKSTQLIQIGEFSYPVVCVIDVSDGPAYHKLAMVVLPQDFFEPNPSMGPSTTEEDDQSK
jgi:hypothetical protein